MSLTYTLPLSDPLDRLLYDGTFRYTFMYYIHQIYTNHTSAVLEKSVYVLDLQFMLEWLPL